MKITTLLENTTEDPRLTPKHGISLYVETQDRKILFDTGPDDTFICNAQTLGIDLADVDLALISHGHYDHGGGLEHFLNINSKAKVLLKDSALGSFYARIFHVIKKQIGLNFGNGDHPRLRLISGNSKIDDNLEVITDFSKPGFIPAGNKSLFKKGGSGRLVPDDFAHEICLVLKSGGKTILFTGCSHSGLGNIMKSVKKDTGYGEFDMVIGGFHLYNPVLKKTESRARMDLFLEEISAFGKPIFYTGHCTGQQAFEYMAGETGGQVKPFRTGTVIEA